MGFLFDYIHDNVVTAFVSVIKQNVKANGPLVLIAFNRLNKVFGVFRYAHVILLLLSQYSSCTEHCRVLSY